jgi:HPt (histidine-containing phosphotransfer) domain-containing protein
MTVRLETTPNPGAPRPDSPTAAERRRFAFEPAPVDAALERFRQLGGEGLVTRLTAAFLTNVEEKVEAARAALQAGDLNALEHAAHSVKSSAGNFAAGGLEALAREIEELAVPEGERAGAAGWPLTGRRGARLALLVGELAGAFEPVRSYLESVVPREEKPREEDRRVEGGDDEENRLG